MSDNIVNITNSTVSTGRGKEAASVDREKMRKQRYKKVNNGKGKKVGFFESIDLKIKGFCDGCKGFPRQTDDKDWRDRIQENEDVESVSANSIEELIKKIQDVTYASMSDNVMTEAELAVGGNIDFKG